MFTYKHKKDRYWYFKKNMEKQKEKKNQTNNDKRLKQKQNTYIPVNISYRDQVGLWFCVRC